MGRDEEVLAATKRFYAALEALFSGGGLQPMVDAWHHTDDVSSAHPMGDWAHGWDEVLATWKVFEHVGRPELSGTKIDKLRGRVVGDLAYVTSVFTSAPAVGSIELCCTNVLRFSDGAWKVVHHHADKSAQLAKNLEKFFE
jgi:hypothetical protein